LGETSHLWVLGQREKTRLRREVENLEKVRINAGGHLLEGTLSSSGLKWDWLFYRPPEKNVWRKGARGDSSTLFPQKKAYESDFTGEGGCWGLERRKNFFSEERGKSKKTKSEVGNPEEERFG